MKLHEYQSKHLFARYGINIPKGRIAFSASEAKQISEELGGRVVVKAQVLVTGRGKAGGIRLARTPKETEDLTLMILGMELKGLPVRKVLVDGAVSITKEYYLGITNDRADRRPMMMASAAGGIEIEEVAIKSPEKIFQIHIDPLLGLCDYQARELANGIDLPKELRRSFLDTAHGLWRVFVQSDATMAEINPLVITAEQKLVALDGKMVIDDDALFRHSDLGEFRDIDVEIPEEFEARKFGINYLSLEGNIGCLVNGAGLAMATMDMIKLNGGEPASFLDVGGGASAEKVAAAFKIILHSSKIKAILVNIFGGITRCDEVARGILAAINEFNPGIPVVTRLVGTNAEEGICLFKEANLIIASTLEEAAQKAVVMAKGVQVEHSN
jgi:succinyl-CoA synthetase beta subunit